MLAAEDLEDALASVAVLNAIGQLLGPFERRRKLNKEINAGLAGPKIKTQLANLGGAALALSPTDFGKLIAAETEKWAKVIMFAGIRPD